MPAQTTISVALTQPAEVHDVLDGIKRAGGDVVARITGWSESDGWGGENATWLAVQGGNPVLLRDYVLAAAAKHGEEFVAFHSGTVRILRTEPVPILRPLCA